MPNKTCVNCSRGCGDFCIANKCHVDDTKDRSDCKDYKRIGTGEPDVLFDRGVPYLYESDDPQLAQKVKRKKI